MLPGPIFRREARAAAPGHRAFSARVMLALLIAGSLLPPTLVLSFGDGLALKVYGLSWATAARIFAAYTFGAAVLIEAGYLALSAAMAVGLAIAEEREKETLPWLLLTRLTRLELALTKLAGRLMPSMLTMLTGLPLILLGAWIADLPVVVVAGSLAMIASTTVAAGGLGILVSSRRDRSAAATGEASAWTTAWLIGLPMAARMPAHGGALWGDLLVELRRVAGWLAPSSPVSLLTELAWITDLPGALRALPARLAVMIAMQLAIAAAALVASVAGLRLREPRPDSSDPRGPVRPPVGDDPIYWREHELPWRELRGSIWLAMARRLLVVLRTILVLALQAAGIVAVGAILIGVVVAAGWYGYFAFREAWGLDASPAGAFDARDQLGGFVLFLTFMAGVMPMVGAAAVSTQITLERDKQTWEPLLMTPLTGPEILSSKRRVVARALWAAQRWVIPLWLLGIACRAVHPLGVVLAAVGLVAGTRLGLALGLRAAIRPGATTRSANTTFAAWYLATLLLGGFTVVAPLAPPRILAEIPREAWLGAIALAAVAGGMIAWERALTRRCFEHFDEWVGRPYRSGAVEPRRGTLAAGGAEAAVGSGAREASAAAVK